MAICVSQLEKTTTRKKKNFLLSKEDFSSSHFHPKWQINDRKIPDARISIDHISYNDRLRALDGNTLEFRRWITDLSMVFKLLNGLISLNANEFFTPINPRYHTRGHSRRLDQIRANKKKSLSQFSQVALSPYGTRLPHSIVNAKSLESFKKYSAQVAPNRYYTHFSHQMNPPSLKYVDRVQWTETEIQLVGPSTKSFWRLLFVAFFLGSSFVFFRFLRNSMEKMHGNVLFY